MKKTSVIALNLRFMRIPIVILLFLSVIATTALLSRNAPPLSAGRKLSGFFISSGNAVRDKNFSIGIPVLVETPRQVTAKSQATKTVTPTEKTPPEISPTIPVQTKSASVELANSTTQEININEYSTNPPSFLKGDFSVLIIHTHTTESYTPSKKYNYTPSDTDRTLDKNHNMVRIGKEVADVLNGHGIKAVHDTTINDYPSYNGSYNRSGTNVQNAISNDSSIKIVLDIHRDAVEGENGEKTKYICDVNGETAASVMLVAGSNLSGLSHDNWEENLNFAASLQSHILGKYPGLMRPINFRSQRFNQQLAPGAIIVEIGTNGNTLDEALRGARYFAEGLADYIETNG